MKPYVETFNPEKLLRSRRKRHQEERMNRTVKSNVFKKMSVGN
jgi:hypothetical protein